MQQFLPGVLLAYLVPTSTGGLQGLGARLPVAAHLVAWGCCLAAAADMGANPVLVSALQQILQLADYCISVVP